MTTIFVCFRFFFFQAEDGIRDRSPSRGLGDVYKRQGVDIDVFVAAHRAEWARLEELVRRAGRPRQLRGAEVDELVALYQRTATHLSVVQSRSPDPLLIGRLSTLVA